LNEFGWTRPSVVGEAHVDVRRMCHVASVETEE
jgi:hypothetical protein